MWKIKRTWKWLWILVPIVAISLPILICSLMANKLNYAKTKYLAYDVALNGNNPQYQNLHGNESLKRLFYGTKDICGGNYVIFFAVGGGNSAPSSTPNVSNPPEAYPKLIYNQTLYSFFDRSRITNSRVPSTYLEYDKSLSVNQMVFKSDVANSPFLDGIKQSKYYNDTDEKEKYHVNYYTYFADYEYVNYGRSINYDERDYTSKKIPISPLYKWTTLDEKNRVFNKNGAGTDDSSKDEFYDDYVWAKDHLTNEYALHSHAANDFRETLSRMALLNNAIENDLFSGVENGVVALAYLNGAAKEIKIINYNSYTSTPDSLINDWKTFLDNVYLATVDR